MLVIFTCVFGFTPNSCWFGNSLPALRRRMPTACAAGVLRRCLPPKSRAYRRSSRPIPSFTLSANSRRAVHKKLSRRL